MLRFILSLLFLILGFVASLSEGQDKKSPPPEDKPLYADYKAPDGQTIPPPVKIDEHSVRVGKVIVNHETKTVSFPAYVNLEEGLVEYILCLPNGKLHESLLVTDADPLHISIGMKLAGFKSFERFFPMRGPNLEWLPFIPAKPEEYAQAYLHIELLWQDEDKHGGKQHRSNLSDLIINTKTKEPFPAQDWLYTNSFFFNDRYQASLTGDIIAIFADRNSTINYIGKFNDGDNESGWIVNSKHPLTPSTPVTIVISQPTSQPKAQKAPKKSPTQ
ncbi:MAG: YdjY domain-containing protein [Akkermansia sp.]